jgi:hypothetical protein
MATYVFRLSDFGAGFIGIPHATRTTTGATPDEAIKKFSKRHELTGLRPFRFPKIEDLTPAKPEPVSTTYSTAHRPSDNQYTQIGTITLSRP